MTVRAYVVVVALGLATASCGGAASSARPTTNFPPRPEGCEVEIFSDAPGVPTENIGAIASSCDESLSDADCLRALKDEACKLGGDVAWGVDEKPKIEDGRKRLRGRAAKKK